MNKNTIYPTKVVITKPDQRYAPEELDRADLRPEPKKEVLLIVGDATDVIGDLRQFIDIGVEFDTMALNYSAKIIPWSIQHFVAGDSHMRDMQKQAKKLDDKVVKHCWNPNSFGFDVRWIRRFGGGWTGTTAMLGLKVGIALDYLRIVLAGIPMDNSGNWYAPALPDDDVKKDKDHRHHLWKWTEIAGRPLGRFIRSMSGNTLDLFGEPTKDWLEMKGK